MGKKEPAPDIYGPDVTELFADLGMPVAGVDVVKVVFYTDQTDPLAETNGRVRTLILTMPTAAFDLYLAACLAMRAKARLQHHDGAKEPERPGARA